MNSLRPSRYTLLFRVPNEQRTLLYNTMTNSIAAINYGIERIGELQGLPAAIKENLHSLGFLVPSTRDERGLLTVTAENIRHDTSALKLALVTGYQCNLSCKYCFVKDVWRTWGRNVPRTVLGRRIIDRLVLFLSTIRRGTDYEKILVDFVGLGEPLLHRKTILNILTSIRSFSRTNNIDVSFFIVTNGTMLTQGLIDDLKSFAPIIQISIDGDRSFHDNLRPYKSGAGTYDRIFRSLRLLEKNRMDYSVRINVNEKTPDHVDRFLSEMRSTIRRSAVISLFPVLPGSAKAHYPFCLTGKKMTSALILTADKVMEHGFLLSVPLMFRPIPCHGCSSMSYAVDMSGDIFPCEGVVGNMSLRRGSLTKRGELVPKGGWDDVPDTICSRCVLKPCCGGICPSWKYFGFSADTCQKDPDYIIHLLKVHICRSYPDWVDASMLKKWRQVAPIMDQENKTC